MEYPKGLDPFKARQNLLHHTYSPLISIQSTYNVDILFQSILENDNNKNSISTLNLLKPFGNNARYGIPNQQFKITNNQLITKNYNSFPIRFEPSLPELLSISYAQQQQQKHQKGHITPHTKQLPNLPNSSFSSNSASSSSTKLSNSGSLPPIESSIQSENHPQLEQLFSISSLELYLRHISKSLKDSDQKEEKLYQTFFNKIITTNKITPFETFNHPIAQIFIIDFENDSIDDLRKLIVEFRNFNFPKFFQIDDLLIHVFIIYDSIKFDSKDVLVLQNEIRIKLNIDSITIPIKLKCDLEKEAAPEQNFTIISSIENCTIEEDLQRLTLNDETTNLKIPESIDTSLRITVYNFINKFLIPHMQNKIRIWDDQMLQPKKSITGRFFSASRKFFNNSDSNLLSSSSTIQSSGSNSSQTSSQQTSFNYQEMYYYKSSPEQTIRKLADWSLILNDFKHAYSTYDLIRKDYSNDRAWIYVASTQEMCIISLLLAQTQSFGTNQQKQTIPDKNTLRKIRHDIIEPFIDNLSYTFKSRLNLKTYSIKSLLMTIELIQVMNLMYNIQNWWIDLIEKYLLKLFQEFDLNLNILNNQQNLTNIANNGNNYSIIKSILFQRLGYVNGYYYLTENEELLNFTNLSKPVRNENNEEGGYINTFKLKPLNPIIGLTRFRRSKLWYHLSKIDNQKSITS
ncbi:uncharacterized protein KGF55_003322 [Candida pseudojiufengensis]|uniref:uncharacterized protein n=1 Tax=Candida pseudojiufengensis TaxID=497109 RepID=UPI0022242B07|nr:uncharacterized protein KGF55_003322 [Candida pseudojiufengensis]KAI5962246.1 hypothetical protein KGF55_003322 [Candida pseudojiufengensis]